MEGKDNGQKEEPDGTGEPPAPAPPTRERHHPSAASAERPAKEGAPAIPYIYGTRMWVGGRSGS